MKTQYVTTFTAGIATMAHAINPIEIKGQRLFEYKTGNPFQIRGLDYYPRPNAGTLDVNNYDFFTDDHVDVWKAHINEFKALGINTIRLYAVDPSKSHDAFMCALSAAGIYVLVDLASSCENCAITAEPFPACYPSALKTRGEQIIAAFAKYNNVLGFSAGNEVNHVVAQPQVNAPCQKKFIRDMRAYIDSCASNMRYIPIGAVFADSNQQRSLNALYYNCRTDPKDVLENVEWYGLNEYLQCDPKATLSSIGPGFQNMIDELTEAKITAPVWLTEDGCLNPGFPTIDGYAAQRSWVQAQWWASSGMSNVFSGGFAFEFSTENANSKVSAPYPFSAYGAQNYGLGYFTPQNCDHVNIPCTYVRMPNFQHLAAIYNNATTTTTKYDENEYTPRITSPPACPNGFAALASVTWPSDSLPSLLCPDLTQTTLCPGDALIIGRNDTTKVAVLKTTNAPGTTTTTTTGGTPSNTTTVLKTTSGSSWNLTSRGLDEANVIAVVVMTMMALLGASGLHL